MFRLEISHSGFSTRSGALDLTIQHPKIYLKIIEKYKSSCNQIIWLQLENDEVILSMGNNQDAEMFNTVSESVFNDTVDEHLSNKDEYKLFIAKERKYNLLAFSLMPVSVLQLNQQSLLANTVLAVVIVFITVLALSFILSSQITRPLKYVAKTIKKIKLGNTNLRLKPMFVTGTWSIQTLMSIRPDMQIGMFSYPIKSGSSNLLVEPNMTFMKNEKSPNADLVDEIIFGLVEDQKLATSIAEFTQTDSLIQGASPQSLEMIREDLNQYTQDNKLMDVTFGNNQIVWYFQDICSKEMKFWLEDKITLEELLNFADQNRDTSGEL